MGLFDRNYMRNGAPFGEQQSPAQDDWRPMLWTLIGINAALFIFAPFGSELCASLIMRIGAVRSGEVYRILTAGFLHRDFFHIFFNMWGLYLFGTLVGPHIGGRRFLTLYLLGVLVGNGLFLIFNWNNPFAGLLGASGAVCAVMAAAALVEPNRRFVIMFLPFWPMKTTTLVVCYTIIELLSEVSGADGSVAHLAHLGGFAAGYFYLKILFKSRLPWDPFRRRLRPGEWREPPPFRTAAQPPPSGGNQAADAPVSSRELDALLDKVSRDGINSLSEYELARLRKAREQMRGGSGR